MFRYSLESVHVANKQEGGEPNDDKINTQLSNHPILFKVELVRAATYQAVDQMMAGENVTMLARFAFISWFSQISPNARHQLLPLNIIFVILHYTQHDWTCWFVILCFSMLKLKTGRLAREVTHIFSCPLYLPLVSEWVSYWHFWIWTWDHSDVWLEWCLDKKIKRRKDGRPP